MLLASCPVFADDYPPPPSCAACQPMGYASPAAHARGAAANADVTGFDMAAPLPKAGSEARLTE